MFFICESTRNRKIWEASGPISAEPAEVMDGIRFT